jgi:hypothetical protein
MRDVEETMAADSVLGVLVCACAACASVHVPANMSVCATGEMYGTRQQQCLRQPCPKGRHTHNIGERGRQHAQRQQHRHSNGQQYSKLERPKQARYKRRKPYDAVLLADDEDAANLRRVYHSPNRHDDDGSKRRFGDVVKRRRQYLVVSE